jgi:futalosine hydrolase
MGRVDLVILGAATAEIAPLSVFLTRTNHVPGPSLAGNDRNIEIARNLFSMFFYRGSNLLVGTTGIGKVNAAAVTAAVLSEFGASEVWNIGCAGAYGGRGLRIGDVLISEKCICADEGILEQDGPSPTSSLGIPLVRTDDNSFYDCFPLIEYLDSKGVRALIPAGACDNGCSGGVLKGGRFDIRYGPSLTVGMTSGDVETAEARLRRFPALAENMEGSAIAQTCLLFGAAFLEIRGISNMAGLRDKAQWDIDAAIQNCNVVVKRLLDSRVCESMEKKS